MLTENISYILQLIITDDAYCIIPFISLDASAKAKRCIARVRGLKRVLAACAPQTDETDNLMEIANQRVVLIHYTLTNAAGEVLDSSSSNEPLAYLQGAGNIIPAWKTRCSARKWATS